MPFDQQQSPDKTVPAKPTEKQAKVALIEGFIWALANRPTDFALSDGRLRLIDSKTGMEWWVDSRSYFRLWSVAGCGCRELGGFGFFQRRNAWKAFTTWQKQYGTPESPYLHEAQRLFDANSTATT